MSRARPETLLKREKLILDADFEKYRNITWFNRFHRPCVSIKGKNIYLHLLVLPKKEGYDVDHIDGNFFNCSLENLRYATRSQNIFNKKKRNDSNQKYKGIQKLASGKYRARGPNGIHLGCFSTPEEAFSRFIEYSKENYGEQFVNDSINTITKE